MTLNYDRRDPTMRTQYETAADVLGRTSSTHYQTDYVAWKSSKTLRHLGR